MGTPTALGLLLVAAAAACAPSGVSSAPRGSPSSGWQHTWPAGSARRALQDADVTWVSAVTDGVPLWNVQASGGEAAVASAPLGLQLGVNESATLTLTAVTPVSRVILLRCLLSTEPLNASVSLQLTGSLSTGESTASAVAELPASEGTPQLVANGSAALAFLVSAETLDFVSGSALFLWTAVSITVGNATSISLLGLQLLQFAAAPPPFPAAPWAPPLPAPPLAPPPLLTGAPVAPLTFSPPLVPGTTPPAVPAPPLPLAPMPPPLSADLPLEVPPPAQPPAPPLAPAVVPDSVNGSSYRLFDRVTGLAPGWTDASCGVSSFDLIRLLDEGGIALSTLLVGRDAGGCASLLGAPFQGWWALSLWLQASMPASASLLVSLELASTAAEADAGLSSTASAIVALDAATLAGSGRQLPRRSSHRHLTADTAGWAHIVVPFQQFEISGVDVWNRVVFETDAQVAVALNLTYVELLAVTASLASVNSADTPQLVSSAIIASALDIIAPGTAGAPSVPSSPSARTLDSYSRTALLVGVASVAAAAVLVLILLMVCLQHKHVAFALRRREPRTTAHKAAELTAVSADVDEANQLASLDHNWRLAAPFSRASLSTQSAGTSSCDEQRSSIVEISSHSAKLARSSTAPSALAGAPALSQSSEDVTGNTGHSAQLSVSAVRGAAAPASLEAAGGDGRVLLAGWFGSGPPGAVPQRALLPVKGGLVKAASMRVPRCTSPTGRRCSPPMRRLTRTGSNVVLDDCELLEQIGSGGEGTVYRALWQGMPVAVKVWHETGWGDEQLASVCREVEVLRRLRHPNVVEFYGACTKPPHWCLVMEYAEGGTLANLLHGPAALHDAGLPTLQLLQLSTEVASALDYLHSARIVHRDLKPQNILLSRDGHAALTDFGIAKHKPGDFLTTKNVGAGTSAYMAPELFGGGGITERVDQYAFGVVLWEMLTGQLPWKGMAALQIIMSVAVQRQRPPLPRTCPRKLRALIEELWHQEPALRPSCMVVRHRLFELRGEEEAHARR